MNTFFFRVEIPFQISPSASSGVLILTETPALAPSPSVLSILLDIDAIYQNLMIGPTQAWDLLDGLRNVKNYAFESCITDLTRELFQ
jgi:uncharacterized protein (TIGR04255 family)